jgi:hypothetical protein
MRYDWRDHLDAQEFSAEFYGEIDRRFFADAAHYLPPITRPFDRLIPFELHRYRSHRICRHEHVTPVQPFRHSWTDHADGCGADGLRGSVV